MNIGHFEPGWSLIDVLSRILEGGIHVHAGDKRLARGLSMRGKHVVVIEASGNARNEQDVQKLISRVESGEKRRIARKRRKFTVN